MYIYDEEYLKEMIEHLTFIVKNTFFMAEDGTLRHQKFGIPMGTNAGPEIANLCLYVDEADHIDDLVQAGHVREAQLHAHTARFIDDVLSWSTLPPPSSHYGLAWKETTNPDGSCTFLGCKISKWSNGMVRLSVFDKAAEWHFNVIRYPSIYSNIPTHQPAGIFTGQVTRFAHICNNSCDFKHAVTQLTLRLLLRGHYASTLAKGWNKYVQKHHRRTSMMTSKITHWFKRMVTWALHHPLADPSTAPCTSGHAYVVMEHANQTPHEQGEPGSQVPSSPRHSHSCPPCSGEHTTQQVPSMNGRKRPRGSDNTSPLYMRKKSRYASDLTWSTGMLCGLHALNACLRAFQCPSYSAEQLHDVACVIDHEERTIFCNDRDRRAFLREQSVNYDSGGFNIQALLRSLNSHALGHQHVTYESAST